MPFCFGQGDPLCVKIDLWKRYHFHKEGKYERKEKRNAKAGYDSLGDFDFCLCQCVYL